MMIVVGLQYYLQLLISDSQLKMMQNYQLFPKYPIEHSLAYQNLYYCSSIMFINPSLHLQQINFNPYLPLHREQAAPLFHLAQSPYKEQKEGNIVNIKNQNDSIQYASKYNYQNTEEQKIQYLQILNRNILPNNLNLILSYIRRINKSGKIVKKIIEKLDKQRKYSVKKFYSYQVYLKQQIPFHKTKQTLKQITQYIDFNFNIFTYQQQLFYNRVCKIVIFDFLRNEYVNTLLTSRKIHKTSKNDHLKVRKYLLLKIQGASQEQLEPYRIIQN